MNLLLARPERRGNLDRLEWRKHPSKWRQRQGVQAPCWAQETRPGEAKNVIVRQESWSLWTILAVKTVAEGLPWLSNGYESTLPLQGARVWSLVGKLRSHMPCGLARRKTRMTTNGTIIIGQTQEDPCLGVTWNDFLRWPFCSESTVKNCLSLGLRWWLFSG